MVNYIQKFKILFFEPKVFFKSVTKEKKYFPILLFFVLFYVLGEFISTVFSIPILLSTGGVAAVATAFFGIVFIAIIAFALPFITSGLVHLGVLLVHGKNGFFNTFKPVTYASAIGVFYTIVSSIIISILNSFGPVSNIVVGIIFGIATFIHIIYAETVGIAYFHKLSTGKALISVLLFPVLAFLLLVILIAIGAIAYFGVLSPEKFI